MIYDLIILGAGIAGTTAAKEARKRQMQVLMMDPNPVGGLCLHEGCIPAKVSLNCSADSDALCLRRSAVIETLEAGLSASLADLGVEVLPHAGTILEKSDSFFKVECGGKVYESRFVLQCRGAKSNAPTDALTPEKIFAMDALPKSAIILGAGAAGLETATYLHKMGSSVTILEQQDTLLPTAEPEISNALLRSLRKKGITLKLHASVVAFTETTVTTDRTQYTADAVIHATGRTAEKCDLMDGLYTAGDALGHHMTAHAAMQEALCAVRSMCGENAEVDYRLVPNVIFTSPSCAWVGDTEQSARSRGIEPLTATVFLKSCGGYLAAGGDGNGVLKLVCDQNGTVLGFHIFAESAADIIAAGVILISSGISVKALCAMQFPHPTTSEAITIAATQIAERMSAQ